MNNMSLEELESGPTQVFQTLKAKHKNLKENSKRKYL
jgi:hypothetical protein